MDLYVEHTQGVVAPQDGYPKLSTCGRGSDNVISTIVGTIQCKYRSLVIPYKINNSLKTTLLLLEFLFQA